MSFRSGRLGRFLAVVATTVGLVSVAGVAHGRGSSLKSRETDTERAGIKLAIYEKWNPSDEKSWKQNGKVILLVHGATWSSKCTFDPVENFSLMESLAEAGYDVFAVDLHGYGHSVSPSTAIARPVAISGSVANTTAAWVAPIRPMAQDCAKKAMTVHASAM